MFISGENLLAGFILGANYVRKKMKGFVLDAQIVINVLYLLPRFGVQVILSRSARELED